MTRFFRFFATLLLIVFAASLLFAQTQGVDVLLSKARSLEARGRMDLAAQNWKQVLLVNPNQSEALAGLARYAKESGAADEERTYLERLRKANPNDPAIAGIEKMHVLTPQERDRLDQAGRLAMQHKPDAAMKIYNEVFGSQPPTGKWAEPYYETEAASSGGRQKAIAQLRRLSARDTGNEVYRLWLARVLVTDPKTRIEGLQMLQSIHDPGSVDQARAAWRQALLWEKENPAVLESVNVYLQRYPDPELQGIQKDLQQKHEHAVEEADKQRGFQALRGKDLSVAEARFSEVLQRSPNDPNAVAGMAFVRLNQKRFDEAAELFDRAKKLAPKRADVREGYNTAKFWSLMQQGERQLQQNQPDSAISTYQQALALQPADDQAMLGIAQAEVQEKKLPDAEAQFQQVLNHSSNNIDAIAGLGFIKLNEKKFDDAVSFFDKGRKLAPTRTDIQQAYKDAKYWSLMQHGAQALAQNQNAAAMSDYREALSMHPNATDALQGLAGAAQREGKYADEIQAFSQLTAANSSDAKSWFGLIQAELDAKNPKQALETAQRVPPNVKPQLESRSDYLSELALASYNTNQRQQGDQLLRRAMEAASQNDNSVALNARLEIAAALAHNGNAPRAVEVYKQATQLHPENATAWQALVGHYVQTRDFDTAKQTVRSMPQNVFQANSNNPGFLNAVAAIYSAEGDCSQAEDFLNRALNLDRAAGHSPSENTQLQLADIWYREKNYAKARQAYHEILSKQPNSQEAWRGYLATLHDLHDDRSLVAEEGRIPSAVRSQLEAETGFVVLLAGAHSAVHDNAGTLQLLKRARDLYQAENKLPPADLDVQLAWAMLNDPGSDLRLFLQKVRLRTDLTTQQRATIDEIWSDWSVRSADQALKQKRPDRAILILADAQRDLPNDPRIYAALASVYAREHNYQKALDVYASWSLRGAEPGDYRSAAGIATAAHKPELSNFYLEQGLQNFPTDPDLLEMKGKQEIAQGNYKQGQSYLKSALRAAKRPAVQQEGFMEDSAANPRNMPSGPNMSSGSLQVPASPSRMPACRQSISYSYAMPEDFHVKLVSATWEDEGAAGETQDAQSGTTAAPNQNQQNPPAGTSQTPPAQSQPATPLPNQPQASPDQQTQPTQNQPAPQEQNQPASADTTNPQTEHKDQQRIQDEIDVVQNRNTPFAEIGDDATGRAGDPGIDRLIINEGTVGGSVTGLDRVRLTTMAKGIYLFSGSPNGQSKSMFGTLPAGATFGQQMTGGITGELQLSTGTFGLDFSATPKAFPIQNVIGGIRFRPLGGPVTFTAIRDSVKDSMLSYAGVRDPGTGIVWGGVVSNTGILQIEHKNRRAGGWFSASFSYLTGQGVPTNWGGSGGAGFFIVVAKNLSIGLSATGMHYDKNLSFFTLGQGGYFSPQQYGLGAIPISWFSRHRRFEYEIRASLGAQYIQQDSTPFFPTRFNIVLPKQGTFASTTDIGPNYSFEGRLGYRVAPHVYFETFATANNARNYASQTVGFSLKIMARRLPTTTDLHVNSVPDWRGNQPFGIQP